MINVLIVEDQRMIRETMEKYNKIYEKVKQYLEEKG